MIDPRVAYVVRLGKSPAEALPLIYCETRRQAFRLARHSQTRNLDGWAEVWAVATDGTGKLIGKYVECRRVPVSV